MKKSTILFTVLIVVCSCQASKNNSTELNKALTIKNNKNLEFADLESSKKDSDFKLVTGECLGECPVFEFYYLKDSLVILSSKKYLFERGEYLYVLNETEKSNLNKLINLNWDSYQRDYKSLMQDMPTFLFQIQLTTGEKRIKVSGKEPSELFNLKELLINKIHEYPWQKSNH